MMDALQPSLSVHHRIVHPLKQMRLVLVHPREPRIPCMVRFGRELAGISLFFESPACCDVVLIRNPRCSKSIVMLMLVVWEDIAVRCFVNLFLEHDDVFLGSHMVRVIQRAWRRFRERQRLALCMAWREEASWLGCVLRTLCVEDLRRMVG